jgi:hypothetical protein
MRRMAALALLLVAACSPSSGDDNMADVRDVRDGDGGGRDGVDVIPDDVIPTDTDGDTIADVHEGTADADGDTLPNSSDADSDGDTIPDATEAGDADVRTPPVDSDGDFIPDFLDLDSDNDGLSDADEIAHGTDPTNPDSDGDGATDIVEVASGTDPLDPDSNPHASGDFVFVVPYEAPPEPAKDTLVFGTDIQMADVYFILDRSASMRQEITALGDTLADDIVPAVRAAIPDVWFGVGVFDLCPLVADCNSPAGGPPMWIRNLQLLAADPALTQTALRGITGYCDGTAEPYITTLWLLATDIEDGPLHDWVAGRVGSTSCPPDGAWVGYPCFRGGAVPIVVMFGDEDFYGESYRGCVTTGGRAPDFAVAMTAMNAMHAKFIGISSKGTASDGDNMYTGFVDVCNETDSVDVAGTPLAYEIPSDGTGLGTQVITAIETLARQVPMDISARAVDVVEGPTDTVDATIFVERLVPNTTDAVADPRFPTHICVPGLPLGDGDGDTVADDYFADVTPGTYVCFDIYARENTTVPATDAPQLFRAQIEVLGNASTVLDTRDVFFLVPPGTYVGPPM